MLDPPAGGLYLSVLVIGEIRRGVERLRRRDPAQAAVSDAWLSTLRRDYADRIVPVTLDIVTRSASDVARTGVPVSSPFVAVR